MESPVITLSLGQLALAFIPVFITLVILVRWSYGARNALYALARMGVQLLVIGYVLAWIFGAQSGVMILLVVLVMMSASAWIAVGTVPEQRRQLLLFAWLSIAIGGGLTLALITQVVLQVEPWFMPRYTVPLAGMVFANAMTAVSLAAERLYAELEHQLPWEEARLKAYQAAMIPVINALLAVGLVSLPGMMTGQILAGTPPVEAVKYQILIMCLIMGATAGGTALAVQVACRRLFDARERLRLDRLKAP